DQSHRSPGDYRLVGIYDLFERVRCMREIDDDVDRQVRIEHFEPALYRFHGGYGSCDALEPVALQPLADDRTHQVLYVEVPDERRIDLERAVGGIECKVEPFERPFYAGRPEIRAVIETVCDDLVR